jgi:protein involved in polysaccharide export with SLBB domain
MSINVSKALERWGRSLVWGLGLAGLLLTGCRSSTPEGQFNTNIPGLTNIPNAPPPRDETIDRISPGDSLIITLSDLSAPTQPIMEQVKQDGTVKVLLDKMFVAAGKSRGQLEKEIHEYYVPSYYSQMTVSIRVEPQTRFYFVDGEIKAPGRQVYIGSMTVLKAIASVGGFTDFANKRNVLLTHPDGRLEHINCKKAIDHPELDLPLYPGDRIYVKRRLFW